MPNTATHAPSSPGADLLGDLASRLDFAKLLDQNGRLLQLETALPQLALIPERMQMREAVSQAFELVLDALSTSRYFELKTLVGEQMSLRRLMPDGSYSPWHGYVTEAAQLGADGGLARWRLVMQPWIAFMGLRRDCYAFQDMTAVQMLQDVFKDYPQANVEIRVSEPLRTRSLCVQYRETDLAFMQRLLAEEGLSYHFRHLDGDAAKKAGDAGHARHVLVITDRQAARGKLGEVRFTSQHASANLRAQRDAITAFEARRSLMPNAVTLGSWNYKHLAGTTAQTHSALDQGQVPALEIYDGAGAYRYESPEHAERAAALALAALELDFKRFEGQGSARHFNPGEEFSLIDHPLYGANTSAANYGGAASASRQRPDNAFVLLAVEHHAANNLGGALGGQITELIRASHLEHGTYKNHFHAAPAAAAVVPAFIRKPTAPGLQTALVVGVAGEPLTTDRDLRVKVQFAWQRGSAPLAGGLPHDSRSADAQGNAPGNERSLTWVRLAWPSAGANWGAALAPRAGTEVAVQFIEGDIDRPVIVGQLYNGVDLPPFSAGVDSGVNHPGVLSGLHSHALDGAGYNQWVVDDATGQLRMRLMASTTAAHVGLGHLIQQEASSAQRGAWRGSGFEAGTDGWASLRAGKGLLVTTAQRAGSYGSAQSGQMDAAEAVALMKGARNLGQRLTDVAKAGQAHPLSSHDSGQAVEKFINAVDVQANGKHQGSVGGQAAQQAGPDGRTPADPVAAFEQPQVLLHTPSTAANATEAGVMAFAGQDASFVAQADVHQAAAHTFALVSGKTTSLYTHEGGAKAYAANGPVSLRAHTDALQVWADKDVTVISVNDEIHISAQSKIEVIGGQSSMVLEGGNVTFSCPGKFEVKGASHGFLGGGSVSATPPHLPTGLFKVPPSTLQFRHAYHDGEPTPGAEYTAVLADGSVRQGVLDAAGFVQLDDVPFGSVDITVGPDPRPYKGFKLPVKADEALNDWMGGAFGDNVATEAALEAAMNPAAATPPTSATTATPSALSSAAGSIGAAGKSALQGMSVTNIAKAASDPLGAAKGLAGSAMGNAVPGAGAVMGAISNPMGAAKGMAGSVIGNAVPGAGAVMGAISNPMGAAKDIAGSVVGNAVPGAGAVMGAISNPMGAAKNIAGSVVGNAVPGAGAVMGAISNPMGAAKDIAGSVVGNAVPGAGAVMGAVSNPMGAAKGIAGSVIGKAVKPQGGGQ